MLFRSLESELIPFDKLRPLKSAYTSSDKSGGRPQSSDNDLGDAGEETRDDDTNANK